MYKICVNLTIERFFSMAVEHTFNKIYSIAESSLHNLIVTINAAVCQCNFFVEDPTYQHQLTN